MHMWAVAIVAATIGCSGARQPAVQYDSAAGSNADTSAVTPPTAPSGPASAGRGGMARNVFVFRSEGPDDGPGFQIAIGHGLVPPARCDYFGHYGEEGLPRLFSSGAYLKINVQARAAKRLPVELPVRGALLAEARSCGSDDRCESPTAGFVELTELTLGVGARGRYRLTLPSGPAEGTFDATWCGPT